MYDINDLIDICEDAIMRCRYNSDDIAAITKIAHSIFVRIGEYKNQHGTEIVEQDALSAFADIIAELDEYLCE